MAGLIAVLAASAVFAYRTIGDFLASNRAIAHSRAVVELLDHLYALVVDAETGVRGYVITGQPEHLEPLEAARDQLGRVQARLREELAVRPEQSARRQGLESAIAAKMARIMQTAALRREAGLEPAVQAVSSGEGKRLMDAVRRQLDVLRSEETRLLDELQSRNARELARAQGFLLLHGVLTLGLFGLAVFLIERDLGRTRHELATESAARRAGKAILDERAEQDRAVRESIIDAIITIDEHGTIQSTNAATERLFGYRADELIGQNVKRLMPSPYREEHDGYLAAYLATGTPKIIGIGREVTARRKDGGIFPVDLAVSEANVEGRRLFTGVLRDLTDRKQAETQLRALQQVVQERGRLADIGAVTAQIVHDLGNPIAGLSMQVQRLTRLLRRSDAQAPITMLAAIADQISASVGRLDGLLQELGEFSRQQRLELAPVDLQRLLAAARDHWQPVAAAQGISLRTELSRGTMSVIADEAKLFRVLDNLVKNAIEAIGRGPGEVCLSLAAGASSFHAVRISISDTGSGIPESMDVFRLFETTKPTGSGLGLSIARRIVEAHGGGIGFARREPTGTVFHIDLPARPGREGRPGGPAR
jgi:two-component system sensor kinase FixL